MATYSSTLAWKMPGTEEPGRLQSMCHKESDVTERKLMRTHCIAQGTLLSAWW